MKHAHWRVLHQLDPAAAQIPHRRRCCWTRGHGAVGLALACSFLAAVLGFGLHVNLSPSAPPGLYRSVTGTPTRGTWVAACVSPKAAALAHARGYLLSGSCPGGVEPVLKPVVAIAGDVVELGPDAVTVNGQRLPRSASATLDSSGRSLPHAVWGRHVVGSDELWLVSTRVANSWDSRYLGPVSLSQVRTVAQPVWTVD